MAAPALTVEGLERWRLFGAGWQVLELTETDAVVQLCTCTGEAVERHETSHPDVIEYLRSHRDTA